MDISNIIKNLHPLETRVLLTFSGKDELTAEKLVKELGYKEGHANQAFSWLTGKSVEMHPITTLLVVLVGGALFGIGGAFVAIPVYIIIKLTWLFCWEKYMANNK